MRRLYCAKPPHPRCRLCLTAVRAWVSLLADSHHHHSSTVQEGTQILRARPPPTPSPGLEAHEPHGLGDAEAAYTGLERLAVSPSLPSPVTAARPPLARGRAMQTARRTGPSAPPGTPASHRRSMKSSARAPCDRDPLLAPRSGQHTRNRPVVETGRARIEGGREKGRRNSRSGSPVVSAW